MSFFVWRRGPRGPEASIDALDPRQSLDWKLHEQRYLQIKPLPSGDTRTLDQLIEAHPCPAYEALS